jgi:hypothetical protein
MKTLPAFFGSIFMITIFTLCSALYGQNISGTRITPPIKIDYRINHENSGSSNQLKLSPPANNECSGAELIQQNPTCIFTVGTVQDATQSMPGCQGTANDDVWYKFIATNTSAKITVQGDYDFDCVFEVSSGVCGSLTGIVCMDLTLSGEAEVALVGNLVIGQTYYIRVYDYYASMPSTPDFTICVTEVFHCIPSVPGATAEIEACGADIDGGCDLATPYFQSLVPGETVTGDAWSDNFSRDRDWYKFHLSNTTEVTFTIIPEFPVDAELFEFDNCVTSPWLKTTMGPACDTSYIYDTLAPGDYMIVITNQTFNGYPCGTNDFYILKFNTEIAQNDICTDAIPVQCGSSYSGTTIGTSIETVPACNGVSAGAPGVWYLLPGNNKIMTVSLCNNTNFDTRLQVYSGNCGSLNCITANDDFCSSQSEVEWFALTGTDYYIYVNGAAAATGNFQIDLSCVCPPPYSGEMTDYTANSTTLTWMQDGTPSTWDIETGYNGFTQTYTPTNTGLTNPCTLNGLNANHDYDFYVRSVCGLNDYSGWVGPFSMYCYCPNPYSQTLGQYENAYNSYANPVLPANTCQLADDFLVPDGECWIITGLMASFLAPSIDSVNVAFYNHATNTPGSLISIFKHPSFTVVGRGIHLAQNSWDVRINFPSPITLCGGVGGTRYWLSVQGIKSGSACQWEVQTSDISGFPTAFRNPGGGISTCTSWTPMASCSGVDADAAFRLYLTEMVPPVITCPADTMIDIYSGTTTVYNYSINATDNCLADSMNLIAGLTSGSNFPIGITQNTWVVADPSGNTDTCSFSVTVNFVIGINDYQAINTSLYPNPSNGKLTIELPQGSENSKISLFSSEGKFIRWVSSSSYEQQVIVDFSDLARGLYFLKFENTSSVYYKKFIRD